jgi:hypothetical protein
MKNLYGLLLLFFALALLSCAPYKIYPGSKCWPCPIFVIAKTGLPITIHGQRVLSCELVKKDRNMYKCILEADKRLKKALNPTK